MTSREPAGIRTSHGLKATREALCVAQAWLGGVHDNGEAARAITTIQHLIDDIDRQRPLGPDGKHGDRHAPTCGCEDAVTMALTANPDFYLRAGETLTIRDGDGTVIYRGRVLDVLPTGYIQLTPNEIKS